MKKIQKINSVNENLIYKKTVYSLKAKINKNNLTKKGYFDLEKLHNLRVVDNGFLKNLRKNYKKTQKELSKLIGVPLRTWIGWESYKKSIPINKLILLSKKLNIKKDKLYGIIKECDFTLGFHHGGSRTKLSLEPNKFILSQYLIPNGILRAYVVKNCPNSIKKFIIKNFSIDKSYYQKTGLIVIYSYLLNKFLNNFYIYKKESILKFPLSKEVSLWKSQKIDLKKSIIIPLLLSDGGQRVNNSLFCCGVSKIIHNIWSDAWFYQYNLLPSSFLVKSKSIFVTTHNVKNEIMLKLKDLCPNFKTSPRNKTKEEYFGEPQPSIKYLFNRPKIEQQIAIRLWANTEGSIGIRLDKNDNLITPVLKIACSHPPLTKELHYLCKINKINLYKIKGKKIWSGLSGLKSTSIKTTLNFLKIGGFIRGTKISSKSEYFKNLDKQDVLLGILEFMLRQRKNSKYKTNDINKVYKDIKNIVINKEFKKEKYYLDIFKNFDNWLFRRSK